MLDALTLLNFGACDRRKILEEDKKRVRDRLLQKQRPKENKYVEQFFVFFFLTLMQVNHKELTKLFCNVCLSL